MTDRESEPHSHGMRDLSGYALVALGVSVAVFLLKLGAWLITGSVGLFSDAMETTVNIAAALIAVVALRQAARPPDRAHQFGRGKAEYVSALAEGAFIAAAATVIIVAAVDRLLNPQELEEVGIGLMIAVVAALINGGTAVYLWRAGTAHGSTALMADAKHIGTDLVTTAGVVLGVGAVAVTGWLALDPLIAIVVAANILIVGFRIMRSSVNGLLDAALPERQAQRLLEAIAPYRGELVDIHSVQSRVSGRQRFVSMHVLVPGHWSVDDGHELCEAVENDVRRALKPCVVTTHLEPREDPRAWGDTPPGAEHELE